MTGLLWLIVAGVTAAAVQLFLRHCWSKGDKGPQHQLAFLDPDTCRCGEQWPCLDSVPGDR